MRGTHQRADIAHWANINLATRQKCYGARQIDGETALDPSEDRSAYAFGIFEGFLEYLPGFLAARLFAAQYRLAVRILESLDKYLDLIADAEFCGLPRCCKFL